MCAGDGAVGDVVEVVGVGWRLEEIGIVDVAGGCGGGGDFVTGVRLSARTRGRVIAYCAGVLFGGVQLLVFLVFLTAFVVFAAHGVAPLWGGVCGVRPGSACG